MKNIEKYYSEFMNKSHINPSCYWFRVIRGNEHCNGRPCEQCGKNFLQWLNEECEEPIKLTKVQYEILKCLPQDSLIPISNNELIIHKDNLEMFMNKLGVKIIDSDHHEEKSIEIKDILEKCEVVE
jgi:hypothetical protein